MDILGPILAIIGLICSIWWTSLLLRVIGTVFRIEKHLIALLHQTTPSQTPKETLEQIKALRGDLARHWADASPAGKEPVKLRNTPASKPGEFFYSDEAGKVRGPHTVAQMRSFFEKGIISEVTPVSAGRDAEWASYSDVLPP